MLSVGATALGLYILKDLPADTRWVFKSFFFVVKIVFEFRHEFECCKPKV